MTFKKRFIFLPFLALLTGFLFFTVYQEVKEQTVKEFNEQQMIIAKQTAKGIEELFGDYYSEAVYLSKSSNIIDFNSNGIEEIQRHYNSHESTIKAITRVDATGKIIYTFPYNKNAIGADISYQDHMKEILNTHKPVISDVFFAVQNYNTVAYHVPVMDGDVFKGTLAILIPFDKIANDYLSTIKLKHTGIAWLISEKGIELYCSDAEHIGKSIFETAINKGSKIGIVKQMIDGKEGITSYITSDENSASGMSYKSYAAYYPIHFSNTHWSICVATPEDEVLEAMTGFRNKLILIIIFITLIGMIFTYFFIRAWIVLIEEKKRKESADELRLSEEKLKESEEKFRSIVENSHDGIIIVDENYKFVYVNEEFCNTLGYDENELIGTAFPQYIEEKSKKLVSDNYVKRQKGEDVPQHYQFEVVRKSGEIRSVEISSSVIINSRGEKQTIAQLLDVTERKKSEIALMESEKKFRELSDLLPQIIYETDINGKLTFVNKKAYEYFGYTKQEFEQGLISTDLLIPEERKRAVENYKKAMNGEGQGTNEYIAERKDGSTFPVLVYSNPIIVNEQLMGLRGMVIDITDIKKSEDALKKSEEQFRSYINNAPDGIIVFNQSYQIVDVNKATGNDTGFDDDELMNMNFRDLIDELDITNFHDFLSELDNSGKANKDLTFLKKDGDKRFWSIDAVKINENEYLGFVKDITERKMLEDQLRQSQKMEAVGHLAGGVAHDFNNILTIINGYGEMLLNSLSDQQSEYDDVKQILKAGKRAESLTRQLLAFGRKQIMQPKILDLNQLIKDLNKMIRRLITENIELKINYENKLKYIKADPGQMEQVILNLVINSRDAMPKGGKLIIETANLTIDKKDKKKYPGLETGEYVHLQVSDTGIGMDKETLSKIYDPFFTTKGEGKGTGLGLSTVYGIVTQSGGFIFVNSEPGKGTSFDVFMKAISQELDDEIAPQSEEVNLAGKETILVVEDEKSVRNIAVATLKKNGYNVISANGSKEVYDVVKSSSNQPDLLLTDVVMPDESGHDIAKKLTKKIKNLKVVYMSGYTNDAIVNHGVLLEDINFIQKPFTPKSLLQKIREVLDTN